MRKNGIRVLLVVALLGSAVCPQAAAGDTPASNTDRRDFTLSGSFGMAMLQGDEYVFDTDGSTVSHLIWETENVPVATFEAEWRLNPRWTLLGSASFGLNKNNSDMEDYDWFFPGQDWTHLSRHPDTRLDRYVALDLGARYGLLRGSDWSLGFLGGLRYTDVQWTAYGGEYIYSSGGFRNDTGTRPEGEKGITYHQMLPALYLGPTGTLEIRRLILSGSVVGGLSFEARDVDDHWLRNLRFRDDFEPAPYLGLQAKASYPIGPAASLFLSADYQRYFHMKGPTTIQDTVTGASDYEPGDAAGGAFSSLRFNAGLSMSF